MNISSSVRRLTQFFIVLFLALSSGLVYWQVVVAQQVDSNPHNGRRCLLENAPLRGTIYDRNGEKLAWSSADKNARCGYVRHYAEPSLAGLIGYYVYGYQSTGLEAKYDNVLSGRDGLTSLDNLVNQTLHQPPIGNDIYLTIDLKVQRVVDKDFDLYNHVDNNFVFQSDRGSVVVSDPHTGQLLALLSRPSFDPNKMVQTLTRGDLSYYNQLVKDKERPLAERPLQEIYTPGSTYKTMTLMAGLDSGNTQLSQQFDQKEALGPVYYDGHPIGPEGNNLGFGRYTFHFPVTTEYGYENSDNVIFAQIGVKTGLDKWLEYNKRLYVGQDIPFDLPVAKSEVSNPNGDPLAKVDLAANAFGQGFVRVTPLQMSLIDNTVANNGQLMRPTVLLKYTDHNKNLLQSFGAQQLNAPISAQSATEVRQAMNAVMRCGGGFPIPEMHNSPWGIIGKTGTGQVDSAGHIPAQAWLITQAPYSFSNPGQLPALTIVAMKENAGEGAYAVGPMIGHMYDDIFGQGLVQAQRPIVPDSYTFCPSHSLWQNG
ncbi:MAG: penicillin-binding transpeptidase domain-containing protein [Ktedonobacteraceae bacterium]